MSSIKEEYIKHKYIKGDEFVTDAVTIMECREERSRDIIDNGRLGTYDNYGNYIILDSIKEELIRLPKVVTLTSASASFAGGNDEYEAKGNIPIFGDVKFKLVVNNNSATFFLIEKVNREAGGFLEIYEEKLETIDLRKEALDLPFIFSYFNITNEDVDLSQKWKDLNIPNILTRKVYLASLSKKIKENSNQVTEEQAFNQMVDMLKDGGDYGKKILDALDERMRQKGEFAVFKGTNAYGKALNDVLLGTIHYVNSLEPELSLENKELYLTLLEMRNSTTKDILAQGRDELSNADVELAVIKINQLMKSGELDEELIFDYPDADEESVRQLRGAILKRKVEKEAEETSSDLNEDGTPKTKEQKIKEILEGKSKAKQQAKKKKVVPAKKPPAKQKMKAKGKKAAKGKPKKKAKKKVKKPVVKKKAPGLKPSKAKPKVAPKKKKKKKNTNEVDLYRRDTEFLRSLFVTKFIYEGYKESKGLSSTKSDKIVIQNFRPAPQERPQERPQSSETNLFGIANRTKGKDGELNRDNLKEEQNSVYNQNVLSVNPEVLAANNRNLHKLHEGVNQQQTTINPLMPGGEEAVMGALNQEGNLFGGSVNVNEQLQHETNVFTAEPGTPTNEESNPFATSGPASEESNPFAMGGATNDSQIMDASSILDHFRT